MDGVQIGGGGVGGGHMGDQVGRSGSQVSVKCALSPRQVRPRLPPGRASRSQG